MISKLYFPTSRDLPPSGIQRLIDGILNIIYPERCFICSDPIARRQECGVCNACWIKTTALQILPPRCSSCGLPFQSFQDSEDHLCGDCILQPPPYSGARSFGYYTGELSALVHGLKFYGRRNLVGLLAPLLAKAFAENWSCPDFNWIVPVPLHPKRRRERGFNQSELLSNALSTKIAIPVNSCLRRIRSTRPQVGLTDSQRSENVRNAFECRNKAQIHGRRILLIDDVMTTGATVSSAAQALLNAGALRVSVLTLARA